MKDARGREIKVGDTVLWLKTASYAGQVYFSEVIGFTPQMVKLRNEQTVQHFEAFSWIKHDYEVAPPKSLLIVNELREHIHNELV